MRKEIGRKVMLSKNRVVLWALSACLVFGQALSGLAASAAGASPVPLPSAVGWEKWDYFNYAEATQKSLYFYDAEKCGPGITGGKIEWRGDCHLEDQMIPLKNTTLSKSFLEKYGSIIDPDGDGFIDVHGGYHDAGDHVRFGLPQAYAASTIGWSYYEFKDVYKELGEEEHIIDLIKLFTDTFLRASFLDKDGNMIAFCFQVGDGDQDHTYWGPPELYPKNLIATRPARFATAEKPGSDVCAGTAAALATSYMNFKDTEPEYAEKCLKYAKAMYKFAKTYRGMADSGGYYGSAYDDDELTWAAAWLYECTNDMSYINDIESATADGLYTGYLKKIVRDNNNNTWQNIWTHSWDAVWGGAFVKLAYLFPEHERFDYFARWNTEYMSGGVIKHEDPKDGTYIETSPTGYTMLNGWGSARYNTAMQLCALVYQKYNPERTDFGAWAKSQMDYIMGRNPMGYSYIVGYGHEKGLPFVLHPHHRAAHGSKTLNMDDPPQHRHILWGALAGGPDKNDYHLDVTTDYVYNEVAVDYNAAFVGAAAGLYKLYGKGQKPIPNFPPKEPSFDPYYCDIQLMQENKERTQVTLKLHNESSQPPHFEKGMMVRYFFNISELIQSGQSIDSVKFELSYDEQMSLQDNPVKASGPVKWDDAGTYYYEFDWSGSDIYGDRDYQFAIIEKQDANYQNYWDPTNDWSRQGAEKDEFKLTKYVPVYLDGKLVYGEEPPKLKPTPTPTKNPNATPANDANIKISYKCSEAKDIATTIRASIKIDNTGKSPINLSDIKVRYWMTSDNAQGTFVCEWAQIGEGNVKGTLNKIDNPVSNADTYCEISFSKEAGILAPGGTTNIIPFRIETGSSFTQTNDYSYNDDMATGLGDNTKISGYVNGALKYGTEPVKIKPSAPPGYKISGYINPGFDYSVDASDKLKAGFKVEILDSHKYAVTGSNGYFEITGVEANDDGYTLGISKLNYLARQNIITSLEADVEIGSEESPLAMWPGDMAKNGIQDNAINISDIIEISKVFNSTPQDTKYKEALDINLDNAINLKDVIIIAKYFNKVSSDYPV
ncbi:glycoside hydrolase family 9 protein [Pseudobacteroides cellulosolvens]|uniref:Cellulase n=1 Tax=Pseudobacteroides cellulosolvens ATCC 35603 = DSM 2933 TaxID=398512 RepID=A0A0L6JHP0_9FIRM|nr:glycoside hydrolase family 9 protein [Pseudobacteroides cellulosolvens]KNY25228.1 Cellulase [Pseudobacteroides cellulosolvens ATCC 35603 = DSM 2933]